MKSRTKDNILTDEEIEMLKLSCKNKAERFLVESLLYTGMRISEFVHMKRDWINFEQKYIKVPEKQACSCYDCRTKKNGIWTPKTPSAARIIPIVEEYEPILFEFFSLHNSVMQVIKSRQIAEYMLYRIAKEAGIKKRIFPHALRGTFATILAAKDFNTFEITAVMGWRQSRTADEYINLVGSRVIKAFQEKWRKT